MASGPMARVASFCRADVKMRALPASRELTSANQQGGAGQHNAARRAG